ncbi:tetratricopeptide repeat protein [Campylobacter corcagiensis]|nr:tetratricopeptide repeat protein [Campylobacter corcagiensis]QKF64841.1 hypothetical protein CCORG_0988 [Campylobacter corcagiensis]
MNNLTKALIYESQGLTQDAVLLYKDILKADPNNKEALLGLKRLASAKKNYSDKLELFYSTDKNDIDKFKRWLVDI